MNLGINMALNGYFIIAVFSLYSSLLMTLRFENKLSKRKGAIASLALGAICLSDSLRAIFNVSKVNAGNKIVSESIKNMNAVYARAGGVPSLMVIGVIFTAVNALRKKQNSSDDNGDEFLVETVR